MAVPTVTGAFAIVDRASRPIRKIRDDAIEATAAVKGLGAALDDVSNQRHIQQISTTGTRIRSLGEDSDTASTHTGRLATRLEEAGAPNLARQIEQTGKTIENTGTSSRNAEKDVKVLSERMDVLGKNSQHTHTFLDKLAKVVVSLKIGMVGALIPAIGLASQAIGGLASGAIALIPRLTDLVNLAGPAGIAFGGMGLAFIAAKLALSDLSKAMQGNKKALAELTPEGKRFLETLKLYKPLLGELRQSAQRGLFPGLDESLRKLAGAQPVLKQLIGGAGGALGNAVSNIVGSQTTGAALDDWQMIGNQGIKVVSQFGSVIQSLLGIIRSYLVAAMPFTNWLGEAIKGFFRAKQAAVELERSTGTLSGKFDRARISVTSIVDVLKNLWATLKNVGAAARPMGDSLWEGLDRITKRWADFTGGKEGQEDMQRYFMKMKPVLSETGKLLGDLAKSLTELSAGSGATSFLRSLDETLPSVTKFLGDVASQFGPELGRFLREALQLFTEIGGSNGPVLLLLRSLNGILNALNKLMTAVPALGTAFSAAFSIAAFSRLLGFVRSAEGGIGGLARSWLGVKTAADQAAASQGRAAGAAGLAGGAAATGAAAAARGEAGVLGPVAMYTSAGLAAKRGVKALPGAIARSAGELAHFALPLMALQGLVGAVGQEGNVGERFLGGVNTGLFGIPGAVLPGKVGRLFANEHLQGGQIQEQAAATSLQSLISGRRQPEVRTGPNNTVDANLNIPLVGAGFNQATGAFTGQGFQGNKVAGVENVLANLRPAVAAQESKVIHSSGDVQAVARGVLKTELDMLHTYEGALQTFKVKSESAGAAAAMGLGQAFWTYSQRFGPDKAVALTNKQVLGQLKKLDPEGRKALVSTYISWAQEQEKNNPKLKKPMDNLIKTLVTSYEGLEDHILVINNRILDGSTKQWKEIGTALESPAGKAAYAVKGFMSDIAQSALGSLHLMGYSSSEARQIVKNIEHGTESFGEQSKGKAAHNQAVQALILPPGKKGARGMRIPGYGLQDTVPLMGMAAPGELIVNRHTENRVDRKLAMMGTSLAGEVGAETNPHSAAMATGGRVGVGGRGGGMASGTSGLHAGIAALANIVLGRFPGLSITSTTGGTHAGGSYHYLGEAVDIGGASGLMNTAAGWVGKAYGSGLTEGIHNPNLSVKFGKNVPSSYWGASTWAEHANHIHLAIAGALAGGAAGGGGSLAGGGGGGGSINLGRAGGRGGGVTGLMARRAYNLMAAGMEQKINAQLGGAGARGGGGHAAGSAQMRAWARAGLRAAGLPGSDAEVSTMVYTMSHESGGNPRSENTWDSNAKAGHPSRGLMELIPENFAAYHVPGTSSNIFDPVANVAASVRYMIGRYGHIVGQSPYAMGGRLPGFGGWFGDGGSATFNRPTMIGVGDGGSETVHVEPAGRGRKAVQITFAKGSIVVHGTGEGSANEFVDKVMGKLAAALDNMGMESEIGVST